MGEYILVGLIILVVSVIVSTFITACVDYILTKHKGDR
jgi:hypothetical protein